MYNQDFIDRIERVYGKDSRIADSARKGEQILGRYLDDCQKTFSADQILNNNYETLRGMALEAKERSELYGNWLSGKASTQESLRERYCPVNYLQNSGADNRYEMQDIICKGVGYVGYYPHCKMWGCKHECWRKFDELNKE